MAGFINAFGGNTGYSGRGPSSVVGTTLTNEGFQLQKPFLEDLFGSAGEFYFDTTKDDAGVETKTLREPEIYAGETIAGFDPSQETAFGFLENIGAGGLAATDQASSGQYMTEARDLADLSSGKFDTAAAKEYINPYIQNVTRQAEDEILRRYQTEIEPRLGAEAAGAGAFGGSRAAILESEGQRNLLRSLGDVRERGLAAGFDQGRRAFEAQKNRERGLAGFYGQLAESAPRIGATEAGLVSSVGEQRRALDQAQLDRAEKEFIEARDAPIRQLAGYQSILQGFPYSPSTYEVETKYAPQPSFGQQLLGLAGTGASLYGAFGGFTPGGLGSRKRGGLVRRRSGGQVRGGLAGLERHQNNRPFSSYDRGLTLSEQLGKLLGQYNVTSAIGPRGNILPTSVRLPRNTPELIIRDSESEELIDKDGAFEDKIDIIEAIRRISDPLLKGPVDPMTGMEISGDNYIKQVAGAKNQMRGSPRGSGLLGRLQKQMKTPERIKQHTTTKAISELTGREPTGTLSFKTPRAMRQAVLHGEPEVETVQSKAVQPAIPQKTAEAWITKMNRGKAGGGDPDADDAEATVPSIYNTGVAGIPAITELRSNLTEPAWDESHGASGKPGDDAKATEAAKKAAKKKHEDTVNALISDTNTVDGGEEQINLGGFSISGIIEGGRKLDDALDAYRKLLEAKDPEKLRTKADEAKRQQLWLTAAKFFSKMGSSAPSSIGAGGFSSILEAAMKSAPDSIDEVNKIQKQFREEIALADKLKEDVAKEVVSIEQARELMRLKRWGIGTDLLDARSDLIKAGQFDPQTWATGIKAMETFIGKLGVDSLLRKEIVSAFSDGVRMYPNNIPGVVAAIQNQYKTATKATGQKEKKTEPARNTTQVTIPQ